MKRVTLKNNSYGYGSSGASLSKKSLKGFQSKSFDSDIDIIENNHVLRSRARSIYMASGMAARAINVYRDWVIGSGLKLKSALKPEEFGFDEAKADELKAKIERQFERWAISNECNSERVNTFYEIEQLALKSWLLSGDCFARLEYCEPSRENKVGLKISIIEADRVSTPNSDVLFDVYGKNKKNGNKIVDGIEIDPKNQVVAYWICNSNPNVGVDKKEWVRVERFGRKTGLPQILHLMSAERPEQRRGVTILASVLENTIQINRYTDVEMLAALIEASFSLFITTKEPTETSFDGNSERARSDPDEIDIAPGAVNVLEEGEKIETFNPSRPNTFFGNFVEQVGKIIASGTSIPFEILNSQFSSSYSASRASILLFYRTSLIVRDWFIQDFCTPIFRAFIDLSVARGLIDVPGYFVNDELMFSTARANWIGPSVPSIDETKTIAAVISQISNGLITHEQAAMMINGTDWASNMAQLKRENAVKFDCGILPSNMKIEIKEDKENE